jgi:diguanylate cyclase (GGDEF)-like protein
MQMETENKGSVLIVDDEKSNITTLTHILGPCHKILAAKNGPDAIELAREFQPNVILLDIVMPDMDGYEVIAQLKTSTKTREIPVIFITGLSQTEAEEKGLSLGASDYITKPFVSSIVRLRVRNQVLITEQIKMIRELSLTDTLTDLPNRRGFESRLNLEWEHAKRNRSPLSVFFIDIDKFKNYNDTYGHVQGDMALKTVASSIASSLNRSVDFVARWGGEEFVVLLPNTDAAGAFITAENVRKNIENSGVPVTGDAVSKVTISIGLHTFEPSTGGNTGDFLNNADKALYNAKNTGRNRVCVYEHQE